MTKTEFMLFLHDKIREAGDQKTLAKQLGISQGYLSDVLLGRREPADKILTGLGLRRVVTFEFIDH